jgi:hypothetical protein
LAGQDLTGQDFTGADLRGAALTEAMAEQVCFRRADLRGADLSHARLAGSDFTGARLGLRPVASVVLFVAALAVAAGAGVIIGLAIADVRELARTPGWDNAARGVGFVLVTALFLGVLWVRGLRLAVRVLLVCLAVLLLTSAVVTTLVGRFEASVAFRLAALVVLLAVLFVVGMVGRMIGGSYGAAALMVVALIGGVSSGQAGGGIAAVLVAMTMVIFAKRALRDEKQDRPIQQLTHRIVTARGTRFTGADLRGATFAGTRIAHTDATEALCEGVILDGTP